MDIALLSLIISVLALDTTIAFQVLVSSPLISCPLLGWLLGDVKLGFEMGFLFQLLWLGRIPAGATIIPEGNVASMIGTSLMLLNANTLFPNTALTLVFLESILISYLGALMTITYRKVNGKLLDMAMREVERAHFNILPFLEVSSIGVYAGLIFALTFLAIHGSLQFLPEWITILGPLFEKQFAVVEPVILGIGLAGVFPLIRDAVLRKSRRKIERS